MSNIISTDLSEFSPEVRENATMEAKQPQNNQDLTQTTRCLKFYERALSLIFDMRQIQKEQNKVIKPSLCLKSYPHVMGYKIS